MSSALRLSAVALALALLPGCDSTTSSPAVTDTAVPWPEGEGHLQLELYLDRLLPYVDGLVEGSFVLTSAAGTQEVPFSWDTDDRPLSASGYPTTQVRTDVVCQEGDGSVEVTVRMGRWTPRGGAVADALPLLGTETTTLACRAGFTQRAQFTCPVADPRRYGQLGATFAFAAPAGATDVTLLWTLEDATLASDPAPTYGVLDGTADAITGVVEGALEARWCKAGEVWRLNLDLVAIAFATPEAEAAWDGAWPSTAELEVPCVAGELGDVTLDL